MAMAEGLVTMITTADMQQAYGTNLEELARHCIVNQFSGEEAEGITRGRFRDNIDKFLKLGADSGHYQEQLGVQEEIKRVFAGDRSAEYLTNRGGHQPMVAIECYRKTGERTEAIKNPKTGLNYATLQDNIRGFLTTITLDGKAYDYLDMVIEHKLVLG